MFWHHSRERGLYRAWLHYGKHSRHCSSIEVSWGRPSCGLGFGFDDERGWGLSFAVPFLAIYAHVGTPWPRLAHDREISFRIHGWALWWTIWRDPLGGWDRSVARWREGSFHPVEVLLGKSRCTVTVLEERDVLVPMPEGAYPARAQLCEYTWKRPRWPSPRRMKRVQIDIEGGIPFPGKGTAAYNCGDDATTSITTGPCASIPEGVGMLVGSVLRDRVRYGGWTRYAWPTKPEEAR